MSNQKMYDKLCEVLTNYETDGGSEDEILEELYSMLVSIQNHWPQITGEESWIPEELCDHCGELADVVHCGLCGSKICPECVDQRLSKRKFVANETELHTPIVCKRCSPKLNFKKAKRSLK